MSLIIKSDKIRWLKAVVRIPTKKIKNKSHLPFMIYEIQVVMYLHLLSIIKSLYFCDFRSHILLPEISNSKLEGI